MPCLKSVHSTESSFRCFSATITRHISGYLLKLTFSNGDVRLFDFSQIFDKGIFVKLQNPAYFRSFTLDGWTVDWNNEIGFAPEYLYENGIAG